MCFGKLCVTIRLPVIELGLVGKVASKGLVECHQPQVNVMIKRVVE